MRDLMVLDQSPRRFHGVLFLGVTLTAGIAFLSHREPILLLLTALFASISVLLLFSEYRVELNRGARTLVFRRRLFIDLPCATYSLDDFQGLAILTFKSEEGHQETFGLALVAPSVTVQLTAGEADRNAIEYQAECVSKFLNLQLIPATPKRLQFRLMTLLAGVLVSGGVLGLAVFVYKHFLQPLDSNYDALFLVMLIPMNVAAILNFMGWLEDLIRRRELRRAAAQSAK